MAIQYKPTKPKKEKSPNVAKTPKAPKAEKPIKIGSVQKVKTTKPAKAPKAPKAPKAEKVKTFAPSFKGGKVKKTEDLEKTSALKKPVNLVVTLSVMAVLVVVAVLALTIFLPSIEDNGQEIKEIRIASTPDKTVYLIGEEANYDGLSVAVTRKNGETFTVGANKCVIGGFDTSEEGYQTIIVDYEGFSTSFSIKVEKPPRPTPTLASITFEKLPKTEYKVGEWLDTTGGVLLRKYADGSELYLDLINSYVFGFVDVDGPGEYVLTVKYMENGTLAETTYTITVTE